MTSRVSGFSRAVRGPVGISAGVLALALTVAGCEGDDDDSGKDAKAVAAASAGTASASPTALVARQLALVDDTVSTDAVEKVAVSALQNDTVRLENDTSGSLLTWYGVPDLTAAVETPPAHGTATVVDGAVFAYTPTAGYSGSDEFTYRVTVKGKPALTGTAVVSITVTAPTPTPSPTPEVSKAPAAKPKPKRTETKDSVYYKNCDAVRAAGAAPIHRGQPGFAAHLDRDGDGVGCEPYHGNGGSSSGGGSGSGGSGSGGGGGSAYYKNCAAARAAGAAPVHAGDPGYGRHLDRDGDGVGCE
ncbi:excalibur calcium-binding domain-containing protein [Streptomyces sp. DT24]|uniref:excalibur calcium-binding domain-containing protein n=1 Tax=unclassified Streptomyces TaxID=2593676 RepID=UPI003CF14F2D